MAEKTLTIEAAGSAKVKSTVPKTHFDADPGEYLDKRGQYIIVTFDPVPTAYQYCRFSNGADLSVYMLDCDRDRDIRADGIEAPVSIDTVTYSDIERHYSDFGKLSLRRSDGSGYKTIYCKYDYRLPDALHNGILLYDYLGYDDPVLIARTTASNSPPYMEILIDTADKVGLYITAASPTSGYVDRAKATTFSWRAVPDGDCYGTVSQSGGLFVWRVGSDGESHSVSVGTASSVTIPALTFPAAAAEIQWQVQLQANSGTETVSKWYKIATVDAVPTAKVVSPASTILDGAADNIFVWSHRTATGSAQTAYELQYSTDNSSWTALKSGTGADTSTAIPANALPGGTVYWRVRTANQDAVKSEWSDAAELIVVAPPQAPGVTIAEASPRPVLQWSALGQQGFEVQIGSYSSGTIFGTEQSWRCPELLQDGSYAARVRIVNSYGLWSDWGAAPLTIAHTPGAAITLSAETDHAVHLCWQTTGAYAYYIVTRDGTPIASTRERSYTDNRSIGSTAYQVIGFPADGWDYGVSQLLTCSVEVETVMLCDLDADDWMALGISDQQHRTVSESLTQTVARVNLSGRTYPVLEKTPWRNRSISINWAGVDPDELDRYDGLLGKEVVVKTPGGRMVYGLMESLQRSESTFYTVYSADIWQLDDTGVVGYDA